MKCARAACHGVPEQISFIFPSLKFCLSGMTFHSGGHYPLSTGPKTEGLIASLRPENIHKIFLQYPNRLKSVADRKLDHVIGTRKSESFVVDVPRLLIVGNAGKNTHSIISE